MYLVRDESAGAHAVRVRCLKCGKWDWLHKMYVDLDGPAFEAYYHPTCLTAENGQPPAVNEVVDFNGRSRVLNPK